MKLLKYKNIGRYGKVKIYNPELLPNVVPVLKRDDSQNQNNISAAERFTDLSLTKKTMEEDRGDQSVNIIGLGPSLNTDNGNGITLLEQLENDKDGIRVLAAAAHRLINQAKLLTADAAVFSTSDSSPGWIEKVHKDMPYHLASTCPPALFKKIEEEYGTIKKFHALDEGEYPDGEIAIGAGTTAPVAALALYIAMGYEKFEFYGVDGALKGVPAHEYAVPVDDVVSEKDLEDTPGGFGELIKVMINNDQIFEVERGYYHQALQLRELIITFDEKCEFTFHGDSFNTAWMEPDMEAQVIYDQRNGINIDPNSLNTLDI